MVTKDHTYLNKPDILMISEAKIDDSFLVSQFETNGFNNRVTGVENIGGGLFKISWMGGLIQ